MKKFIPGNPAMFRPLTFRQLAPAELRAKVFKQPVPLALPSPATVRALVGVFVCCFVVAL